MEYREEKVMVCPRCESSCYAEWKDLGYGPHSIQIAPYQCCSCDWQQPEYREDEF
ncbi:MAG: hypothetical protein MJB14_12250 [Spirochaetes bacterium]|nr:hypothetical protein [Spirochaetota bacterium]